MYINLGNIYMYIEREATVHTNNTNKSKILALEKQNCVNSLTHEIRAHKFLIYHNGVNGIRAIKLYNIL